MTTHSARTKQAQEAIRQALRREWNPIGIGDLPDDEYDSYAGPLLTRLKQERTVDEIFDHLWNIETEQIGLGANREARERTKQFAERLKVLWRELEETP